MPPAPLRTALAAVGLAAGLVAAARPVGPLPALGPFLDPANGVWAGARAHTPGTEPEATLAIPGLAGAVRVVYDGRGVPHIFATTEADAYRALGFVVARDRLFQLHASTMAASGRLTEFAGARALGADREMRALGLPRAAERKLAALAGDSVAMGILRAYADGVNAWIDAVDAAELPVEFKLTGTRPERWDPLKSLQMMGRMGWTLANIAPEIDRLEAAALVGRESAASLFPEHSPIVEPIQPNGQSAPRYDAQPVAAPGAPDTAAARALALVRSTFGTHDSVRAERAARALGEGESWRASNNWAVAPARTRNGHALLAGDPHLELSLPSIWYEAHLVVPGTLDVYGVTIPGLPGVVIGFNRDVAWTFTNTGADVQDWYAETVDDAASPRAYTVDGARRALELRVETYRGKGGEIVAVDTVRYTHRGPLRRLGEGKDARWFSMRWTVLEPSRELAGFPVAARARTATAWLDAMSGVYFAPAQNMLVADRQGTIAIRSIGHYPVRPTGDGGVVQDGATARVDWTGYLPVAQYPQAVNPAQGFLASANQEPIDPRAAPGYFGGSYEPWRALRINQLLRADSQVTVETVRAWQRDPGSARADWFVPRLLAAAGRAQAAPPAGVDARRLAEAVRLLGAWDRRYVTEDRSAVLFEWTLRALNYGVWDEFLGDPITGRDPFGDTTRTRAARVVPPSQTLLRLLDDSTNAWWDDRRTTGTVETRETIVARALVAALDTCVKKYGAPGSDGWRWGARRHANVWHLTRLPAFSALGIPVQGGPSTLSPSANTGVHGASWRMVVELGPEVRGWGTYPGGQSGDPASPGYRDRLASWTAGELQPLASAPRRPEDVPQARGGYTLTPAPAGRAGGR